uniref:AMP-dependent synthetase/ligase domain-containing protein n=1 Tax=Fagus sylvatica TaxID=28930 RepID=A0A2N9GKZ5_FAGSY
MQTSKIWYYSELIKISNRECDLLAKIVTQSDIAALMYSSGTTGMSKGVILTHKNFIANSLMMMADQDRYGDPKNVFFCFLPMFHIYGLSVITDHLLAASEREHGGFDGQVVSGAVPLGRDVMEECAKVIPHADIFQREVL